MLQEVYIRRFFTGVPNLRNVTPVVYDPKVWYLRVVTPIFFIQKYGSFDP